MGTSNWNSSADERGAFEIEIAQELRASLDALDDGRVKVQHIEHDLANLPRVDFVFDLDVDGTSVRIAVAALRYAYPRDVQGAVWKLDEFKYAYAPSQSDDLILLVAAESLSPGARELLRKRGIGYFERNGNLNFKWRNWLINIERPDLPSARRGATSLFTDSREAVVHALLVNRLGWLSGSDLAAMAQTSQYTVSVVLQELERREWCETNGAGRTLRRRLSKPRELLDAWAVQWKKRKEQRSGWYLFHERQNPLLTTLTDAIESTNPTFDWALTGTNAANVYAPLLTNVDTVEIIVPPGRADGLARDLRLKPAEKGANVVFVERDGASLLFRGSMPGYPSYFASPFIMYLDLLNGRGRNKELADHVLKKLEL
jgi:hypothetical protein